MKKIFTFCALFTLAIFVQAQSPKLWGVTEISGTLGGGTSINLNGDGSNFNVDYNFGSVDNGAFPQSTNFCKASNGLLYGMTSMGGANGDGNVFSFNPVTRVYTNLFDFTGNSGAFPGFDPWGSLIQATDGKLYGATSGGGTTGNGVIFSFDLTTNTYASLYQFPVFTGVYGSLLQASDGLFYGLTSQGGLHSGGYLFSFDGVNPPVDLYDFPTAGTQTMGSLIQATGGGLLYGMTNFGGAGGNGNIFSYDITGPGYSDLYDFTGTGGANPGANPNGDLVQVTGGDIYGMTSVGGSFGMGNLFSFTPGDATITDRYDFNGASGDTPYGNLVQASDGNLYGMTYFDGTGGAGNLFSIAPGGSSINDLFDFNNSNNGTISGGANPSSSLVQANNGLLYGMTFDGGSMTSGNIFSFDINPLNPAPYIDLVDFGFTTSATFSFGNGMVQGADGKLYGITNSGGTGSDQFEFLGGDGAVYSFDPVSGTFTELYDFVSNNGFGATPYGSLVLANDGKMYGMTYADGLNSRGTIFTIDTFGTYTDVYDFSNAAGNGVFPYGSLIQASNGLLYGMTSTGGLSSGFGEIFSFDPGSHVATPMYNFTGGTDGGSPYIGSSLVQGSSGLLYGMTSSGGAGASAFCFCGEGVIFSIDPTTYTYNVLWSFDGVNGGTPGGSLVQQTATGLLYGMNNGGGGSGPGVLFSMDPNPLNPSPFTELEDFDASGDNPYADNGTLYVASDGNLYGGTTDGGSGRGVVFSYDPVALNYNIIRNLSSSDGQRIFDNFFELRKIATSSVTGPLCAGAGVSVPFTVGGYYTPSNVFTAQLSDASGSFSSPVDIGMLSGTTSGAISATIPGGTTTGTGYRIRVVSSSPVITGGDNGSNISISSCATINTWLGHTPDWNTTTNWSLGTVPACADVEDYIPATSNDPVISVPANASNLVIDNNVTLTVNAALSVCGNLTGGSSSAATIQGTTALTLTGTALQTLSGLISFHNKLAVDNTLGSAPEAELASGAVVNIYDALVLQNDNTLDASLGTLTLKSTSVTQIGIIDNFSGSNSGTVTGNITAERFYGSAPAANDFKQHMLGSPVNGINLSALGSSSGSSAYYIAATGGIHNCNELLGESGTPYGNVFSYDETHASTCTMDGWKVGAASTAVSAGTGYSVVLGNGSGTLSLTGAANLNSSYSVPTTNTGYSNTTSDQGRVYSSGINLVSNPYSATLDVSSLNTTNSANFSSQTVYVWNVTTGSYDMNPATIAPFQAFKVIQSAAGSSSYTIPGSSRTTSSGTFQRTANPIELNMTVTNNSTGLTDNTIVGFNPNSTVQFDAAYDVIKLPGALSRHTMYTLNSNYWLAVNVLKSIDETSTVPVGFEPGVSGTYTANFSGLSSFDPTSYITLEDKQMGIMYDVRSGDYTFTSDAVNDSWNRFVLHFTPPASINTTDATCSEQGMINIIQPGAANWIYTIADINNATLSSGTLNSASPVTASLPTGVYTLTLVDNNGYTVVKTIQVNGVQPVLASFTASANTVNVNQEVTLSSAAANAVINSWNFGDGTTDNGATVSHAYTNEGVYSVTLNSTSASGCSSSANNTITVTRSATGVTDLNDINNILIWSNENMVNVDFTQLKDVQANIEIYNILGQKLSEDKYVTSTVYHKEIPNIEEGYIVVSVKNNDEIITKKLFISNIK